MMGERVWSFVRAKSKAEAWMKLSDQEREYYSYMHSMNPIGDTFSASSREELEKARRDCMLVMGRWQERLDQLNALK